MRGFLRFLKGLVLWMGDWLYGFAVTAKPERDDEEKDKPA